MTAYTNPLTGRSEQITDSRALATREERIAAGVAAQAAFEHCRFCHKLTCIAPNVKLAHASTRN